MEPGKTPPTTAGSPRNASGSNGQVRTGHAGWDFKDAFWGQWDRVLGIRSGGEGDLTGATEALATLALMAADAEFLREWRDRPVHAVGDRHVPTLQDNQAALEVIAGLVRRKGWAEKQRSISVLKPWTVASDALSKPE